MSQSPYGEGDDRQVLGNAVQGQLREHGALRPTGLPPLDGGRPAVRVVVADDSPLTRQGIEALLTSEPGIELVAVCDDGLRLEQVVEAELPDVVLLDIGMPPSGRLEGMRLARSLHDRHPTIGMVLLSQHVEPEHALELMRNGTSRRAYLLKDNLRDGADLGRAIHTVSTGGSVLDPQVVDALLAGRAREQTSPLQALTARERQVLAEMAQGKSNSAIAQSLVLTRRAVEKHVNAIFSKLDLGDPENVSRRVKATLVFLANSADAD
jgi:DNA-binding NarL/FixJ family response regulator